MYYGQTQDRTSTKQVQSEQVVFKNSSSNSSTTTTTTRYTEPCVLLSDELIEHVAAAYSAAISPDISPIAAHMMEQALKDGMTAECLIMAINDTGWAQRPSPQYLRAILRRCREQGIKSADQYRQAQSNYARSKTPVRSAWKVSQFNYQNHGYTEADFGPDFYYDPTRDQPKDL